MLVQHPLDQSSHLTRTYFSSCSTRAANYFQGAALRTWRCYSTVLPFYVSLQHILPPHTPQLVREALKYSVLLQHHLSGLATDTSSR